MKEPQDTVFAAGIAPVRSASPRAAFVATYPPRECGIGTFTYDLVNAYDNINPAGLSTVIAMTDYGAKYDYDLHDYVGRVRFEIETDTVESYRKAADFINGSRIQVVNIQHEYGIFGGPDGEYILELMERCDRPVVLTLHTVLPQAPSDHFRQVTQELLRSAAAVCVLAKAAAPLLCDNYDVDPERVQVVPHGVPVFTRKETIRRRTKQLLGFSGRRLLSTFGLIGPSKAIEFVIEAMPDIVAEHPDVLYLVLGETHPVIRSREGESYRNGLIARIRELNLTDHIKFNNRFLSNSELVRYLAATDVYIMPYLGKDQIVSGTLAYAVGCGKAVVATPFTYAQEMLSNGRGVIVPFRDSEAIATAVIELLSDRRKLLAMEEKAYRFSRNMTWPSVAQQYSDLFRQVSYHRPRVAVAV
jgi:glycosyltransferase involved in cell wall biosynthesis